MAIHNRPVPGFVGGARPLPSPVKGEPTVEVRTQAGVKLAEQQAAQKLQSPVTAADLDAFLKARAGQPPRQRGLVPSLMKLLGVQPKPAPSAEALQLHKKLGEAVQTLGAIYADGLVTESELSLLQQARGQLRAVLGLADPNVLLLLPKDVRERVQNQLLEPLTILDQAATRRAGRVLSGIQQRDEAALRERLAQQPVFRHLDIAGLHASGLSPFSLARYQPGDFIAVPRSDGSVDKGVVVGRDDDPPGVRVEILDRRTGALALKTLSQAEVAQANPLKIGDYVEAPGIRLWVTGAGPGGVTGTVQDARGRVRAVDAATVARIAVDLGRALPSAPSPTASSAPMATSSGRGPGRSVAAAAGNRVGVVGGAAATTAARTSRQSLDQVIDTVWKDRAAFLSGQKNVYSDVYNAVIEKNVLTRPKAAFLADIAAIAAERPQGAVSNTQCFGGGGDAISGVVQAWKDGRLPAEGMFSASKLESTFFRFERTDWQPDKIRQRVYLNAAADKATELMKFVVREIIDNPARFPGVEMAKLSGPGAVGERSENIVLYTHGDDASRRVLDAIAAYRAQHPTHFMTGTPAFTEQVSPGVALGDEPAVGGGRMSFGSLRAGVILEALRTAERQGLDRDGFARLVDDGLRRSQVDPQRPHKNLSTGGA